jgi:hypothetical protein
MDPLELAAALRRARMQAGGAAGAGRTSGGGQLVGGRSGMAMVGGGAVGGSGVVARLGHAVRAGEDSGGAATGGAEAVRAENRRAAQMSAMDARWLLAVSTAGMLEGGRQALLRPERREALLERGRRLGLRSFDANLVIAVVQDGARTGSEGAGPGVLSDEVQARLKMVGLGGEAVAMAGGSGAVGGEGEGWGGRVLRAAVVGGLLGMVAAWNVFQWLTTSGAGAVGGGGGQ